MKQSLNQASKFARTSVETKGFGPMAHQAVSLKHDASNTCVYDASDAGTGKTAVRIWAFARRRKAGGGKALILAPRTLLRSAWANDFRKFAPHLKVSVATAENREKAFKEEADAYITNHDAVRWLAKQKPSFWEQFTELIVDEATAYKNHTSQRSRAITKIADKHFRRPECHLAAMSATPNSNGISNIWNQVYILDGGQRLGNSFYSFRNTICTPRQVGRDKNAVEWVDKDGAEEAVFGLLSDMVIRHRMDDCMDIPQTYFHEVEYELPPAKRKMYDQIELTQIMHFTSAPDAVADKLTGNNQLPLHNSRGKIPIPPRPAPSKLTALNAASVLTKLLQVCSGAVYDNDGHCKLVDTGRYELILDLVEAREHSLVFFQWSHQKDQLVLEAQARRITYCVIDGETSADDREAFVRGYQAGLYQVMFAHPKTAAHGLTLTRGTTTIWSGPIYDLELYEQGNKRQRRIGQAKKTEVIMVLAKGTVEEKVYAMLQGKDKRMKTLLDLFSTLVADRRV